MLTSGETRRSISRIMIMKKIKSASRSKSRISNLNPEP